MGLLLVSEEEEDEEMREVVGVGPAPFEAVYYQQGTLKMSIRRDEVSPATYDEAMQRLSDGSNLSLRSDIEAKGSLGNSLVDAADLVLELEEEERLEEAEVVGLGVPPVEAVYF